MAEEEKEESKERDPQEEKEFIKDAKRRLEKCKKSDSHNRLAAVEDLKFLQGDQWDLGERQRRKDKNRPCLQINVLPKYSKQVCGEMRKNKSRIKVRPVDSKGDIHLAKIREGLIYNIEYLSDAESIYDYAGKMLVDCGYGAWRICTRWTEENCFLQEIYMEPILNPFTVYFDPMSKRYDHSDANYCFIVTKMEQEDFDDAYGKKNRPGGDIIDGPTLGVKDELYWDRDSVTVAEYFYVEKEEKKMAKLSDGQIMEKKEADLYIASVKESYAKTKADYDEKRMSDPTLPVRDDLGEDNAPTIVDERTMEERHIKWARITGTKILEEKDWPGHFIPVVLVTGEETNIEGKRYIKGLIRDGKDPQKLLNTWHTSACETIALAPKAPWQATARMIEGYEQDYLNANEDNLPVMLYNIDPAEPQAKPSRLQPGQAPQAIFAEISRAQQSIKDCIGLYNADVGDTSNEHLRDVSGKAIMARQMPGDTATFVFPDNMNKGIIYGGKIINDLIPAIYDTERDVRLRNADDSTEASVPINTTVGKAVESVKESPQQFSGMNLGKLKQASKENGPNAPFNDITIGKYDVVISSGPNTATQRAEMAENILKIGMATKMAPLDKYFLLHSVDGMEEYAEAVKQMVPPHILPQKDGDKPRIPPPTPPQVMLMQAKMKQAAMKEQLDLAKLAVEKLKLQKETLELAVKMGDSDARMKKIALDIASELNSAPGTHPADGMLEESNNPLAGMQGMEQMGNMQGGQQQGMPGM